jgi:hypothetical protein
LSRGSERPLGHRPSSASCLATTSMHTPMDAIQLPRCRFPTNVYNAAQRLLGNRHAKRV